MSIMYLAISIKNEKHDICISNMIIRADDKKLEEKRCDRKVLNWHNIDSLSKQFDVSDSDE